jgi:hypothetical protein
MESRIKFTAQSFLATKGISFLGNLSVFANEKFYFKSDGFMFGLIFHW